tara:strand:- start:12 stop:149 length:138 start_codon:yes stop_codon:yes gene_type:complete
MHGFIFIYSLLAQMAQIAACFYALRALSAALQVKTPQGLAAPHQV